MSLRIFRTRITLTIVSARKGDCIADVRALYAYDCIEREKGKKRVLLTLWDNVVIKVYILPLYRNLPFNRYFV